MQFFPFSLMNSQDPEAAFGALSGAGKAKGKVLGKGVAADAASASGDFADLLAGKFDAAKQDVRERNGAAFGMWDRSGSGVKALTGMAARTAQTGRLARGGFTAPAAMAEAGRGTLNLRALAARTGAGALPGMKELSALKMTREDFLSLKKGLRSYGISSADITALEERIGSEGGLTWGQFMSALSDQMVAMGKTFAPVQLTGAQERDLSSFFQKVGFTPEQADGLLGQLRSGKYGAVWDAVGDKLASLPDDARIDLKASELSTLGKVMQLSESGQARLTGLLGGASGASLAPKSLQTVMTVLKAEVAADAQVDAAGNKALAEAVGQALTEAAERAGLSASASNRTDNTERNQKVLGEHSRRERAQEQAARQQGGTSSAADDGETSHAERIFQADPRSAAARGAAGGDAAAHLRTDPDGKGEAKDAKGDPSRTGRYVEIDRTGGRLPADADAKGGKGGEGGKGDDADAAWKDMWGKVRSERTGPEDAVRNAARFAAAEAAVERASGEALKGLDREVAARALRQVESGILKNMSQGRKQLVLRLDPANLGKLNMILQVKDGEVSATFRAETQDGHRMLSENLSQLRQHLEQQGIKVGKMEVQTQLTGDQNGNQWLGEGDHNQAREQENSARRKGLLRRLRGEGGELAQEMQNEPRTARIAREGLDIIA